MTGRLPVALSCGEPSGIGTEISLKAWQALGQTTPFFWIGDRSHLPTNAAVSLIDDPKETLAASAHGLPVLHREFSAPAQAGRPDPNNAPDVIGAIQQACDLVATGTACAVCTGPIHKKALKDGAGFAFPGHTEFLADIAGVERAVMMLASDTLRVVPATIHMPLSAVVGALTPELLQDTIRITHDSLIRLFDIAKPRIAVAGLNPHAGEGGVMGREELEMIAPLLDKMRADGMDIRGPLPADTLFHDRARAGYDVAIAMYHDQALIPIKTLAFDAGVNITLGLPFVRTSPDHGTAFDIAGQGCANPGSMIAALKMAYELGNGPHK